MRIQFYQYGMDLHGAFARMTRVNPDVSTYVCISRIWLLDDCMPKLIPEIVHQDTVSERLRRWIRNPLGSASRGSNPLGVDSGDLSASSSPFLFLCISLSRRLYWNLLLRLPRQRHSSMPPTWNQTKQMKS